MAFFCYNCKVKIVQGYILIFVKHLLNSLYAWILELPELQLLAIPPLTVYFDICSSSKLKWNYGLDVHFQTLLELTSDARSCKDSHKPCTHIVLISSLYIFQSYGITQIMPCILLYIYFHNICFHCSCILLLYIILIIAVVHIVIFFYCWCIIISCFFYYCNICNSNSYNIQLLLLVYA